MITRKSLATLIREALEKAGKPVIVTTDPKLGALRYEIDGRIVSPGEAADMLGIVWECR